MVIANEKKKAVRRRKDCRKKRFSIDNVPSTVQCLCSNPSSSLEQCIEHTMPPITEEPISPMSPDPPHVRGNQNPVASKLRGGKELPDDYMLHRPFNELCRYLQQLDLDYDGDMITELVLRFSLKIYGLPECCAEDLRLAVYMFIEDVFGIQSKIQLCVPLCEGEHSDVIGVVFETIQMKYNILQSDKILEGTEVRMKDNKDLQWITEALAAD